MLYLLSGKIPIRITSAFVATGGVLTLMGIVSLKDEPIRGVILALLGFYMVHNGYRKTKDFDLMLEIVFGQNVRDLAQIAELSGYGPERVLQILTLMHRSNMLQGLRLDAENGVLSLPQVEETEETEETEVT